MPFIIKLHANYPGCANFEIQRWKGNAEIQIAIQRNQDSHYFAEGNLWKAEPVWHTVQHSQQADGSILGQLTSVIVDPLVEQGSNVALQIWARSGDFIDRGVLKLPSDLMSSSAGGSNVRADDIRSLQDENSQVDSNIALQSVEITDKLASEIIEKEEVTQPKDSTPDAPRKSSKLPLLFGLLLMIILGAVAVWFLSNNKTETTTEPVSIGACEIQHGVDELLFIQGCLKTNPNTEQLLEIINKAKAAKACNIAQRLYANKAQSGNAQLAFAYAKEYDNQFAQVDGCFKADNDNAIYWYETGLSLEPDNAEAKARLEALKK